MTVPTKIRLAAAGPKSNVPQINERQFMNDHHQAASRL